MGLFFLYLFFWFFIIISLVFGYVRIKWEWKIFYIRIVDIYDDLKFIYIKGLISGFFLLVVLGVFGILVFFGLFVIIVVIIVVVVFIFCVNWMFVVYIVSVSMLICFGL